MYNRPRCREWEPLWTHQMRVRNIIQLCGVNFSCSDKESSLFYFTLHLSAFSKPLYTSERVQYRSHVEWPEINCQQVLKSSHKFVCIRVWKMDKNESITQGNESPPDKMLFMWGVYISGLVLVSDWDDVKFEENTLLFHLPGGTFTSATHVTGKIPIGCCIIETPKLNGDHTSEKYSLNGKRTNDYLEPSPKSVSYLSPLQGHGKKIMVPETLNKIKPLKVRHVHLSFAKNEIQPSYTLDNLLQLQNVQRLIHNRNESAKMLTDRIQMRSAACLNLKLIMSKPIFYEPQKQAGMGKTLSRLLSEQQAPPKPEVLIRAHDLRMKIEYVRFKIRLLAQECDRSRHYNKVLTLKREQLKDENTETEARIWNGLRTLSRENLKTYKDKLSSQHEAFVNVKLALLETRRCLLRQLNDIYTIKKNQRGQYTINHIHLPDAESYTDTVSTPTELSIALGYVAHTVLICSRILNIPLRNPIRHEGSRSKILDNIKVLPLTDKTFPLFCRSSNPENIALYGVYLLNQNISQLKFILGMSRGDLRATLANLWDLMNGTNAELYCRRFNEDIKPMDNSASSVDSVLINIPINIPTIIGESPRISRSLNDFDDDCRLEGLRNRYNSSAPDLTGSFDDSIEQALG